MKNSKELKLNEHHFEIRDLIGVSKKVIENSKKAISIVWDKHVGKPNNFNIIFASYFVDSEGKNVNYASQYDPDFDNIKFAIDSESFKSFLGPGFSTEEAITLFSAHEVMHKIQFLRGDKPTPTALMNDREYINDRFEQEAWNEALHVYKKINPDSRGGFTLLGYRFEIPEKSKY